MITAPRNWYSKTFPWLHLLVFTLIFLLGTLHLLAVLKNIISQGDSWQYNFRYYSIFLVGFLLVGTSSLALLQFRKLSKGSQQAKRLVVYISLFLLAMNLPIIPNEFNAFPYISREAAEGRIAFGLVISSLAAVSFLGLLAFRPSENA